MRVPEQPLEPFIMEIAAGKKIWKWYYTTRDTTVSLDAGEMNQEPLNKRGRGKIREEGA